MNKEIYNSLNKIVPNKSQKDDMYNNILSSKNKKIGGYILKTATLLSCFVITFILFNKPQTQTPITPRIASFEPNEIIYNDTCYISSNENYELGKEKGIITILSVEYKVYENKVNENSIIIEKEDLFEVYNECGRN